MTKISTLRNKGFRLVKLTGNTTMISHDMPFRVAHKKATHRGDFRVTIGGHYTKEIPHEVELLPKLETIIALVDSDLEKHVVTAYNMIFNSPELNVILEKNDWTSYEMVEHIRARML